MIIHSVTGHCVGSSKLTRHELDHMAHTVLTLQVSDKLVSRELVQSVLAVSHAEDRDGVLTSNVAGFILVRRAVQGVVSKRGTRRGARVVLVRCQWRAAAVLAASEFGRGGMHVLARTCTFHSSVPRF